MRKYFVTILIVFLQLGYAGAAKVTQQAAARYAARLMGMTTDPVAETGSAMHSASRGQGRDPEYYIFNNPDGGWAIISADDRTMPVIAYSDEGRFITEDMPENMVQWMDDVASTIDDARKSGETVSEQVKDAWMMLDGIKSQAAETKKWIKTASWDQESPYNESCPRITGESRKSPAGCMATAMAITLRHNSWPAHGKGTIGGYSTITKGYYIKPYSINNHNYDWDEMPMTNAATAVWTFEQKQQVAQLMYDCGVMIMMNYTQDGSGAFPEDVVPALKNHLLYSDKVTLLSRLPYSADEWFSLLANEIDADRVCIMSGKSVQKGGHAFVCDGYDTDGQKIHINWGWGGNNNGYYTLDLRYRENEIYNYYQTVIIGIAPNTAAVDLDVSPRLVHQFGTDSDGVDFFGIKPVNVNDRKAPVDVVRNSAFSFSIGVLENTADTERSYDIKVCLMDSAGTVRQEGWEMHVDFPAFYAYVMWTSATTLNVDPAPTDYFMLYAKLKGGEWEPVQGNHDFDPDIKGVCCGIAPDPIIIRPETCVAGQEMELKLTLGYIPYTSVKWTLNGSEYNESKWVIESGETVIRADVEYLDGSAGSIWTTINAE